jgi:hypothetical protein
MTWPSTEHDAGSVTLEGLAALFEKLRPRRIVCCANDDELAVRRAVNELEAEGFRVEVAVSEFVKLGTVIVLDPSAVRLPVAELVTWSGEHVRDVVLRPDGA